MPNSRQTRHPPTGIGLGVDRTGGPVIDPTENVLALVDVQRRHQGEKDDAERRLRDELRIADLRLFDTMRKADRELAEAETRRIDGLREMDRHHAEAMEKMRSEKLDTTAKLLAENQKETKNDLQVELRGLNQFRWESGGKSGGMSSLAGWILSAIMLAVAVAAIVLRH